MRLALVILAASFSLTALACPDLAGYYQTCRNQAGQVDSTNTTVSQDIRNGSHVYTMTSTSADTGEETTASYIANGQTLTQTYTDPNSGMTFVIGQRAACKNEALTIAMTISLEGQLLSTVNVQVAKFGEKLVAKSTGVDADGNTLSETSTCE